MQKGDVKYTHADLKKLSKVINLKKIELIFKQVLRTLLIGIMNIMENKKLSVVGLDTWAFLLQFHYLNL